MDPESPEDRRELLFDIFRPFQTIEHDQTFMDNYDNRQEAERELTASLEELDDCEDIFDH